MPWLLVWKSLTEHKVRTLLTLGSLAIAIFLVVFLRTVVTGIEAGVAASASNRLMVQSAVSLFVNLPLSYQAKIEALPGVERACTLQWFGGVYQEPSNFFAQFAVDHERFLAAYPEIEVIEGSAQDLARSRTACLVGRGLAERFAWRVGDRVPLIGTIFPRTDGGPWELQIVGIYRSRAANVDEQTLWFRFDYLDESLTQGAASGPPGAGVFVLGLAPGADPVEVGARVDALFENGPQRVQSTTEAEFQRQFVSMLGSVPTFLGAIGGGVLFAIALAVFNTMLLSARQRTRDLGVMKALGFADDVAFAMLIAESLLLCAVGGGAGILLAVLAEGPLGKMLVPLLPSFVILPETFAIATGIALALGVCAGALPAWQASQLRCVEALRAEG